MLAPTARSAPAKYCKYIGSENRIVALLFATLAFAIKPSGREKGG